VTVGGLSAGLVIQWAMKCVYHLEVQLFAYSPSISVVGVKKLPNVPAQGLM